MAETIAEFVAKLGFEVKKSEETRFNSALNNLAATVAGMAATLVAAAATITTTVLAVSKSFDELYWIAQRTNSTVQGLRSLSYAFSQIGSTGGEAQTALEGLAKAMRTNPGTAVWLNSQGVKTAGRKNDEILTDVFTQFKKKPYWIGAQFAAVLGVSEDTFNKASKQWDEVLAYKREFEKTQAKFGVNSEQAAQVANKIAEAITRLMMVLQTVAVKVTVELQPLILKFLQDVTTWFTANQEQLVQMMNDLLKAVAGIARDMYEFAKALAPVARGFVAIAETITGDKGLKAALETVMIFMTTVWITNILTSLGLLARNPVFLALLALAGIGYDIFYATPDEKLGVGGRVNDFINGPANEQSWFTRQQNKVRGWFGLPSVDNKGNVLSDTNSPPRPGLAAIRTKSGKVAWVPAGSERQFQGFINDFEAAGGKIDDIGGFADRDVRGRPGMKSAHGTEGAIDVNPSAANPWATSSPLPANISDIAKKWGLGWGGNWKSRTDTPHFSMRPGEGGRKLTPEELDQLEKEQRARAAEKQSMMSAPPLGSSPFKSASIDNKTSITIYGSSDPAGTAANLGGAQKAVMSSLIRNSQSAFV